MRGSIIFLIVIVAMAVSAQNPLNIPPSLTGTNFQLNVQSGTTAFYPSRSTPTYGINGALLGPTLIVNRGDSISITVHNGLSVPTTMHWHGLHVAPYNDGGPNQIIAPGTSWSPSFVIRNQTATYWYHPHGAGQTDPQVSKGLAGMIIVHDSVESALGLPHTYGVDDIPVIVQTKAFDVLQQIAISTEMDTAIFVNGTLDAYFNAPAQVVRLRLLNGSSMRSYYFGFSNNQSFYQVATDGGLKDTSVALSRLRLSPGERAEILIDLQGMNGQSLNLMSYSSALPRGIYGAAMVGMQQDTIDGYNQNFLNGADFKILQIHVSAQTGAPVTNIPISLKPYSPYSTDSVSATRYLVFDTLRKLPSDRPNQAAGPFGINQRTFNMDSIDLTTMLDHTEIWVLKNNTYVAHPFHIHDVQFNVIEKSGTAPIAPETGWKDVVLVMPQDSVKFITRFETFAHSTIPYMYHCHLLHHEDDGMMGSFLVLQAGTNAVSEVDGSIGIHGFPIPSQSVIDIVCNRKIKDATLTDIEGRIVAIYADIDKANMEINTSPLAPGTYVLIVQSMEDQTGHIRFSKAQ